MPARTLTLPLKSILTLLAVFFILYYTGSLAAVTQFSQAMVLPTGLLDANPTEEKQEPFPFGFELTLLNGQPVAVESLKGKVLFINVWATWCGPCRAEMPSIEKLFQEVKNDNIAFVMLSIDKPGNEAKVKKYITDNHFTFPVYRPASKLPALLDVPSIPTTFVVDKAGNVVYKNVGSARYHTKKFKNYLLQLAGV
jgi:thiol-disulfide isomerase/thioredoxin